MNLQLQVKSIAIEVLQTDFVPVNKSGFSAYTSSFAEELKTLVEMLVEDQKEPFSWAFCQLWITYIVQFPES